MIVLFSIIGVILILFFWILVSPIVITIDSEKKNYSFHWKGLVRLWILNLSSDLIIRLKFGFWKKDFDLLKMSAARKAENISNSNKKNLSKSSLNFKKLFQKKWSRVLNSFQIKTCQVNIDTSSFIRNSYLFPIFYFLSNEKRQLKINYLGENQVHLSIENRFIRILKALLF